MREAIMMIVMVAAVSCGSSSDGGISGLNGTVLLLDQEAGVFGLLGDDGVAYEPRNLPSQFEVDGMRIRCDARMLDEEGAWGKPVDILDAKRVELPAPGIEIFLEGTVVWIDLEGGFFGILGDDGKQYDPLNLPAEFQIDGLRVVLSARIRDDAASAHMWGYLITIDNIDHAE